MAIVELQTTGVAKGGEAVAREASGRVVFVEGALPGERVEATLVDERRGFARARLLRVVDASPHRVTPPCPVVADGCGGCDLQHASVPAQRSYKETIVSDALERLAKVDHQPPIEVLALPVHGYRTTVHGLVVPGPNGGAVGMTSVGRFALRRRHSHDPVEVQRCMVLHPLLDELVAEGDFGDATEVTLRCGARTGERIAVVKPNAVGVSLPADVRVVGADELRAGKRVWFHEQVRGVTLRVSAESFFQARPDGAEALIDAVESMVGPLEPHARVVDAYAGVGLFGATVLRGCEIVAIERGASSVADARVNLRGLRARIVKSDVERFRPVSADVVVADPARAGLGRVAVEKLASTGASRLVLVSCDPAAFGRDVALLAKRGFSLERVLMVDLFGHTSHIELVSLLTR